MFPVAFPTPFQINGDRLVVRANTLDYEFAQSYSFNVTVIDGGVNPLSDEAQVEITVLDINDNSPLFSMGVHLASVFEGDYRANSFLITLVRNSHTAVTHHS